MVDSQAHAIRIISENIEWSEFSGTHLGAAHHLNRFGPLRRLCLNIVIVNAPISIARLLPEAWRAPSTAVDAVHDVSLPTARRSGSERRFANDC